MEEKSGFDLSVVKDFINKESLSGIVLFIATVAAILVANSSLGQAYLDFWNLNLGISLGEFNISMTLTYWIDDALMALFFLMVGLEIKRELLYGELSSLKKASLPIFAALGGMIVPAFIYFIFNTSGEESNGFGIPMATDIAFALGVLMLLGRRVPLQFKVFLVSLAVVDDLGAVIVIALFYTSNIDVNYLFASIGVLFLLFLLNKFNVKSLIPYLLLGVLLWITVHSTGVHATIAGVLLALFIPIHSKINDDSFIENVKSALNEFSENKDEKPLLTHKQQDAMEIIASSYDKVQSPLVKLEHSLHSFSAFVIMPLFAFSNAGFVIDMDNLQYSSIMFGIAFGLLLGKPIGIVLFSLLAVKLKIAQMPQGMNLSSLLGVGLLAGIGFTMSIFISHLAFESQAMIDNAKFAILVTSFIAAIIGSLVLIANFRRNIT
ncbi:MAG: Na+/H+ antiporter NhaA [Campylobacterota bacterium]